MISVEKAQSIIRDNIVPTIEFEQKNLSETLGCILFEDQTSPINMPPFRQSAMDGYALHLNEKSTYQIIGEIKAGDPEQHSLDPGEAVRIFTGAAVPESANAVIMQEKTIVDENILTIDDGLKLSDNIRPLGEQIEEGQVALQKGSKLTSAAIGFLASIGITQVNVFKMPSIAIIATGNELVPSGTPLGYGQIYESNSQMLMAALQNLNFDNVTTHKVNDQYNDTLDLLSELIDNNDVVLVSGGISVGDYDFVGKALDELKVKQLFYKVNQKPGKPLYFGKKDRKIIFALPGNPTAALSCFYLYVHSALEGLSGNPDYVPLRLKALSISQFGIRGGRDQFLKAIYQNGKVEILEGQSSSMLHTFALANAFVYVPHTCGSIQVNDEVEVILLPIN